MAYWAAFTCQLAFYCFIFIGAIILRWFISKFALDIEQMEFHHHWMLFLIAGISREPINWLIKDFSARKCGMCVRFGELFSALIIKWIWFNEEFIDLIFRLFSRKKTRPQRLNLFLINWGIFVINFKCFTKEFQRVIRNSRLQAIKKLIKKSIKKSSLTHFGGSTGLFRPAANETPNNKFPNVRN